MYPKEIEIPHATSGEPAAHPNLRLLLLPSGPDRVHTMESHEARHHIRPDYHNKGRQDLQGEARA